MVKTNVSMLTSDPPHLQKYCSPTIFNVSPIFPAFLLFAHPLFSNIAVLEKPLEKKAGRNYGPPGSRRLIYFVDDMNMPEVDEYGTVQPHTLIRQHMDYNHW